MKPRYDFAYFPWRTSTGTIDNAAAVCPNCHKRCHHSIDVDFARNEPKRRIKR
jgi:predicted HNH restriction endonuclease